MNIKQSFTALFATVFLSGLPAAAQQAFNLKECIDYGLKNHRSVSVYQNNKKQADAKAREALAGYLPNVNLNGEGDINPVLPATVIPAGAFGAGTPETVVRFGNKYQSTITGEVDQQIFNKSILTGIKASKPNQQLADLNATQNNQTIIYNIADAYYQILTYQKQLDLLTDNKTRFEKILQITQLQAEQGVAKKVDVKQVQVNLNNTNAQIVTAQNNLDYAYNSLKYNMGLPLDASVGLTDTARWLTFGAPRLTVPNFSYAQTIDYQIRKTQIQLYDLNRQSIKDGYFPSLSIFARYGANGYGNRFADAYNKYYDYAAVGLKLSWNIFDGFKRKAQITQATVDYENAIENMKLQEQAQSLNFQNAQTSFTRAQNTVSTNQQNMELARDVYESTTLQYKEGATNLTALLNAEESYKEAQTNYIQSLLDYYIANLNLERANGTLENYYNNL